MGTSWSGSCAMCGGCCGGRSLDGDAIRARRPNNGDAVCLYSSVEAYESSAYLGVLVVVMVGWHGRRCGYDVRLLGAAGSGSRDKPAVAIGVASARRCLGEEDRGG